MKSFWISLSIFAVLLFLIVCNGIYINQTANELQERISSLPSCADATAATSELTDFWEREKNLIGLSVPYEEISALDSYMTELSYAVTYKEENDFEKSRRLALRAAADLRRLEQFTVGNLF